MTKTLYQQFIAITEEYLGPAAPRFVDRQIIAHLDKEPTELTVTDLPKLAEWTKVTLGLLTEDRRIIAEYSGKIDQLARDAMLLPNAAPRNHG